MVSVDFSKIVIGGQYDRPTLARLWGYSDWHAIGRGVVTPAGRQSIILFVTREKQHSLTQYVDYLSGDHLFWEGENGHGSDERILRASKRGDMLHLFYREMHHSSFEYRGPLVLVEDELRVGQPSRFVFRLVHSQDVLDDLVVREGQLARLGPTERESVTLARLGQGEFRRQLIHLWHGKCAVTGTPFPEVLRASHIKPWRTSSNADRLNPYNGLLLLSQYDQLFDRGYIGFENDGRMLLSKPLASYDLGRLGIRRDDRLRRIRDAHHPFLDHHRQHILRK